MLVVVLLAVSSMMPPLLEQYCVSHKQAAASRGFLGQHHCLRPNMLAGDMQCVHIRAWHNIVGLGMLFRAIAMIAQPVPCKKEGT